MKPLAFLHRAGSASAPSSLPAIQRAAELGFTHIETDIRVTSDHVPVLIHDRYLPHTKVRISSVSYAQVESLYGPELIPRLDEVLGTWPQLKFSLDLKNSASISPSVSVLRSMNARERVCLTSFNDFRTVRARGLMAEAVCTGAGVVGGVELIAGYLARATRFQVRLRPSPAVIQVPLKVKSLEMPIKTLIEYGHQLGLSVHFWTANDRATIGQLIEAGADGIISDNPVVLKEALVEAERWPRQ